MCKGAHKTHKRSGAQAQAKRLIPQNGKKENKGLNENGREEIKLNKESSQGLFKGTSSYEPQEEKKK
jgi:hypothetical protein